MFGLVVSGPEISFLFDLFQSCFTLKPVDPELPPFEVIFADTDVANEFRTVGTKVSKKKNAGISHLYFNTCLTLSTR